MAQSDRKWMYERCEGRKLRIEFVDGVREFVEFAKEHTNLGDSLEIRCPCSKCKNKKYLHIENVKQHLYRKGFVNDYFEWVCHGEDFANLESSNATINPYMDMVIDALGSREGNESHEMLDDAQEEPNPESKKFLDMLRASKEPLYEGSHLSVLEMASRITNLKCEYNLPHRCVDSFASLISEAIPSKNLMKKTFYETNKVVHGLELPHEKIHACPNGCMLFWKDNAHLEKCMRCGGERYKMTARGKRIPVKVLTYFPITPRLQRLYATANLADEMQWHSKNPRVSGKLSHPSDSDAWKHLDATYPEFSAESRNVRLGLCTDGFAPHGQYGGKYSCWPVIMTPYNLPPSLCMKKPFMFLTLLIPGPKNPKGNLDVYLQPLIEELKFLWEVGALTYDVSKKQNFNLKAALLWTISDFPAYGMLSGRASSGKLACPYCLDKSKAFWLDNGGKVSWFDCHRQFLAQNHVFRKNRKDFCNNKVETRLSPPILTGHQLWERVKECPKATDSSFPLKAKKKDKTGLKGQSIFWQLPYWKDLLIRHNLDVMHIEKNFFDQLIHTIMNVKGKSADTLGARKDMEIHCRRTALEPIEVGNNKWNIPKAPYTLDKQQCKVLCEWVKELKFPDGYASNLGRCVDLNSCKLYGMKSHDCHVFMERLLPVALRELLPANVWNAITEISQFFRDLCSYTIEIEDMERLEKHIPEILCKLERIFPPAFFNSMEHLPLHLPYEAKVGGPVQYRWMYPFERFLNHLKRKIGNKARVEGSICNAYLAEEISNFCTNYFQPHIDTKARDFGRNVEVGGDGELDTTLPPTFSLHDGHATTKGEERFLNDKEFQYAHMYVLANSDVLGEYERMFEEFMMQTHHGIIQEDVWSNFANLFPKWLEDYVLKSNETNEIVRALAMGPSRKVKTWRQFMVNGFRFHTYEYGKHKATMNYGVGVKSHEGKDYFGILEEVIELVYLGVQNIYKTVVFQCKWMDSVSGVNVHEHYKLVDVNHSKKYPIYDPFVLAHQVYQVYFTSYPSLKKDKRQWWAVFKTKARSDIDAPIDESLYQEALVQAPTLSLIEEDDGMYEDDMTDIEEIEDDNHQNEEDEEAEWEDSESEEEIEEYVDDDDDDDDIDNDDDEDDDDDIFI